ncbi:MAG: hypothetical protein PWQ57_3126 [Desulfovibrionales bacterium]|nr:hypothetical protein [Desulfovibrionales bacterium]
MSEEYLYIARQPIFDCAGKVWGCRLLYRENELAGKASYLDGEEATLRVAASLLVSPDHGYSHSYTVLSVSRDFLLQGMVQGLGVEKLVVSIPGGIIKDAPVIEALTELKRQGCMLSVDILGLQWCQGADEEPLFDVVEVPWSELSLGLERTGCLGAQLLVKRIETHEQADRAIQAGAQLLQGFFFEKPRTFQVRPLSSTSLSRLRILQILEAHSEDLDQLTEAVESDVSLALRLLKLINSASFALSRRIESVHQAVVLVGWNKLRNWLRLIVITDMAPSRATNELAYASAVRAKFLELAAIYTDRDELSDKLYMLGLFSLLEAMLEKSFTDIFRELKLDEDVSSALLEGAGPLKSWLSLARLMDTGAWLALDALAAELGLSMKMISRCRIEAFDWAKEFFQSMR